MGRLSLANQALTLTAGSSLEVAEFSLGSLEATNVLALKIQEEKGSWRQIQNFSLAEEAAATALIRNLLLMMTARVGHRVTLSMDVDVMSMLDDEGKGRQEMLVQNFLTSDVLVLPFSAEK